MLYLNHEFGEVMAADASKQHSVDMGKSEAQEDATDTCFDRVIFSWKAKEIKTQNGRFKLKNMSLHFECPA